MGPALTRTARTDRQAGQSIAVSPTALGVTLIGVILGIGATVGFGLHAAWPVRLAAAFGTVIVLGGIVKALTRGGHGALSRLAIWLVGGASRD
jgi:hypothetical protein